MNRSLTWSLALLFIIGGFAHCAEIEYQAELQVPSQCVIGQLVEMRIIVPEDASVDWGIRPVTEDFRIYENGRVAVFSARTVGSYTVMVACAVDGVANLLVHEFEVAERTFEQDLLITARSIKGYATFEEKRAVLAKLEALFRELPGEFEGDLNEVVGGKIEKILGDEQSRWEPLFDVISVYLKEQHEKGTLDYSEVWLKVAEVLKKAGVPC